MAEAKRNIAAIHRYFDHVSAPAGTAPAHAA